MKTDSHDLFNGPGWRETLLFISRQYPVPYNELRELWHRHNDLIIVETIVHIAASRFMPLRSAEQLWVEWWKDNKQEDCPGELYQITVVLDKDLSSMPVCFGMLIKGGQVAQSAPISRWQVGRTLEQVREWVKQKGGAMERVETDGSWELIRDHLLS